MLGGGVLVSDRSAAQTSTDTNITKDQAQKMAGCEAEFKEEKGVTYLVIKPKDGANEGIISADLRPLEFEALRKVVTRNDMYNITLKFEGTVHGYGSISGLFSDTRIESLGNIGFDVSNVTNMSNLFSGCYDLENLDGLKNWNTSKVTDMSYMFWGCKNLKSLVGLENWNTSNVTDMNSMFCRCFFDEFRTAQSSSSFLDPIGNWDVSKVTNMESMFYLGSNLVNIDALKNWNTSNVKNMSAMFSNCKKIKNLDGLEKWKTSNVTDMSYMFQDCGRLLNINGVKNWDTSNVTNMQEMFARCLKSVNVCDDTNVNCLLSGSHVSGAPNFVSSVSNLDAVKNWDVSKVSKMGGMFAGSDTLTDISALKNWTFNKDLPYIDLGYLVTGNRISNNEYVGFLKSLIQKLNGFKGVLELDGFRLEKLNETQINEIFVNSYDSIILVHKNSSGNIDTSSALLKLKTKKKVTLTFNGSTNQSIEINDLPAVYISSEAYFAGEQQSKNNIEAVSSVVNEAIKSKIKELQKTHPELTGKYAASRKITNVNDVFQTYNLEVDRTKIKNPDPNPNPSPLPEPSPSPEPTPNPTPGGDTPGGGLNPNGGGSGNTPGNNPNNNPGNGSNNGNDNTNGSGDGTGNDNTKNDNTNNNGNGNGDAGNNGNNTNGSNTNRNRNGGSAGGNGLNAGGNGSNSSNSAKSNASDSAKDSSKNHSDSSDSAKDSTKDSAKDSAKDSKDSAKSSASSSAKRASKSSNFGLIASIIGALAAFAAIVGGFFFFILFGKKRKKRKDEDENEGEN